MQNTSSTIKQRIKSAEKQIGEKRLEPHKPGLVEYDPESNPPKYYVDDKEYTEEEFKNYMEQFDDQDCMTIFTPTKNDY